MSLSPIEIIPALSAGDPGDIFETVYSSIMRSSHSSRPTPPLVVSGATLAPVGVLEAAYKTIGINA